MFTFIFLCIVVLLIYISRYIYITYIKPDLILLHEYMESEPVKIVVTCTRYYNHYMVFFLNPETKQLVHKLYRVDLTSVFVDVDKGSEYIITRKYNYEPKMVHEMHLSSLDMIQK